MGIDPKSSLRIVLALLCAPLLVPGCEQLFGPSAPPAQVVSRHGAVRGRVVDEHGAGVSASIVLEWRRLGPGPYDAQWGTENGRSDAEGRFEITGLDLLEYTLSVNSSNHSRPVPTKITLSGDNPVIGDLQLVLEAGCILEGSLFHADGAPAHDMTVKACKPGDPGVTMMSTGVAADGSFRIDNAPRGAVRLLAIGGYMGSQVWLDIVAPSVDQVAKRLTLPAMPTIVVLASAIGAKPAPKLVQTEFVQILPSGGISTSHRECELLGGSCTLRGIRPGEYSFRIIADGFPIPPAQNVVVTDGQTTTAVFVFDGEDPGVSVQVVDENGNAIQGASVDLEKELTVRQGFWSKTSTTLTEGSATTDAMGIAKVFIPVDGGVTIHVSKDGYRRAERGIVMRPEPGGMIRIELDGE